jgi:hypothetical protein
MYVIPPVGFYLGLYLAYKNEITIFQAILVVIGVHLIPFVIVRAILYFDPYQHRHLPRASFVALVYISLGCVVGLVALA